MTLEKMTSRIIVAVLLLLLSIIGVGGQAASLDFGDPSILSDINSEVDLERLKTINRPDDIPQIKDWKDDCEKLHGADTVKEIEAAPGELMLCVKQYVKIKKLQIEVNKSMAGGSLDRVFKKYCGYRDNILSCVDVMLDKFRTCMNGQQLIDVNVTRRALDAAINFTCHDDGDRIALFMAEQGVECLKEHKDGIRQCVEERLPEIQEKIDQPDSLSLDSVTINEEQCGKLKTIHECIVQETKKCPDSTPSNILESLMNQMLLATPCWDINARKAKQSQQAADVTSGASNIGGLVKNTIANIGPIFASSFTGGVGSIAGLLAGGGAVAFAAVLSYLQVMGSLIVSVVCSVGSLMFGCLCSLVRWSNVIKNDGQRSLTEAFSDLSWISGFTGLPRQLWLELCCSDGWSLVLVVALSAVTAANLLL